MLLLLLRVGLSFLPWPRCEERYTIHTVGESPHGRLYFVGNLSLNSCDSTFVLQRFTFATPPRKQSLPLRAETQSGVYSERKQQLVLTVTVGEPSSSLLYFDRRGHRLYYHTAYQIGKNRAAWRKH